jgi:hypothetical protein
MFISQDLLAYCCVASHFIPTKHYGPGMRVFASVALDIICPAELWNKNGNCGHQNLQVHLLMSHRDCHKLYSGFLEIMKSFGRIVSVLLHHLYDRLTPVSQGLGFPFQKSE